MEAYLTYLLFFAGFALLVKGAGFLIDGASALARRLGVSSLVIGLTIVAFGTSLPEFTINLLSALTGKSDIAIGNIIGANIADILLVLGVSALIYPLAIKNDTLTREIPFAFLSSLVLLIVANRLLLNGEGASAITRSDGLLFLLFFSIFLAHMVFMTLRTHHHPPTKKKPLKFAPSDSPSLPSSFGLIALGIIALGFGGKWVVDGAVSLARLAGLSEYAIAATIVSIGTTLPELFTSITAAYRKQSDLAVGNVVGSVIFNTLFILGISSLISPIPLAMGMNFDIILLLLSTLVLFLFIAWKRRYTLHRWHGSVLLLAYALYLILSFVRG